MASNDSLSIWDELAFAHQWFFGLLDAPSLFHMATQGGADILGLSQQLGSLAVGKQSSFQVLEPAEMIGASELHEYFVETGRTADIAQVYVSGRAQLSGIH